MKKFLIIIVIVAIGILVYKSVAVAPSDDLETVDDTNQNIKIDPISHATAVISFNENVIYIDPVGGADLFVNKPEADIILVTDIHGDHLNIETLQAVISTKTQIIAPQAVADKLTPELFEQTKILSNGGTVDLNGLSIEAVPMYNLPESDDSRHIKGRGNGYVVSDGNERLYIAGDTADIPEMRSLKDIDFALVPMNLPYTMTVEAAADAVLEFKPKKVSPYHYRGQDGFSDINEFKKIVNEGDSEIEVVFLEWY